MELALPAALLYRVYATCVDRADASENDIHVLACLRTAAIEPLTGLAPDKARKVSERVMRVQRRLMEPYEDRPVMVAFLVVLYWLKGLLDDGRLALIEGSKFDEAVSLLLASLSEHDQLWNDVEKTAIKNARRFGERLVAEGYYA